MSITWRQAATAAVLGTLALGTTPSAGLAQDAARVGADVDAGTLDPRLMRDTTAYRVNNLLYDGLVNLDAELRPQPGLAESWENPEPTVWLFHLRDDVTFHDGEPLTADDVVYTFETILDPELQARFRSLYTPISKIEAVDERTVRIELSEPYAPLLSYLDVGIVPKHVVEAGGDLGNEPVGSGPMKLAEWRRGSEIVLEPNPEYFGGAPARGVAFVVVPDNTARAQAFEAGDLDLIQSPLSPQDIRRLEEEESSEHAIMGGLGITYLNFNTDKPPLDDPKMRRALAHLVDQETIVNQIYEGVDQVASSILLPSSWAYSEDVQQPQFDPAAAKALFAELGWADSDDDGVLDKDGETLSIELSTHSEDPNRIQAVEYLQNLMRNNGVDATVSIADWPSFSAGVQNGQHEVALLGWLNIVDPDRLMYGQLHCDGDLNWGGYCNEEVSSLLDQARSTLDAEERAQAYQEAAKIIADEVPYYVISYQGYQVFYEPELAFEPNPRGMLRSVIAQ